MKLTNISTGENEPLVQYSHKDVTVHNVETTYTGFYKINEYQITHKLIRRGYSDCLSREIFERGDAVVVIPYDPVKDQIVLIEQFRAGALQGNDSPWLLEFIAGMFDDNENPEEVAIREAEEEANLIIDKSALIPIMKFFPSPGGTSECIHLYAAKVDTENVGGIYGLPEEGEDILVHVMGRTKALSLLAEGKIYNAATIIGLQWLALNYQQFNTTR
jgi:ADP-ribose pyrophosphatase